MAKIELVSSFVANRRKNAGCPWKNMGEAEFLLFMVLVPLDFSLYFPLSP